MDRSGRSLRRTVRAALLTAVVTMGPGAACGPILAAFATSAIAQSPPLPSNGWDNAYYQILAESLRRAGHGKWVYSADGHAIGRIADVRTSSDGMHEVALVRLRRLLGGGEVILPVHRLTRRNGRIVARDDRAEILAMARLAAAGGGLH